MHAIRTILRGALHVLALLGRGALRALDLLIGGPGRIIEADPYNPYAASYDPRSRWLSRGAGGLHAGQGHRPEVASDTELAERIDRQL